MANIHIAALHDRIDEEHFEMRLHARAIAALQQRVILLEAAVNELRIEAFGVEAGHVLQRDTSPEVSPLRNGHARSSRHSHAGRLA